MALIEITWQTTVTETYSASVDSDEYPDLVAALTDENALLGTESYLVDLEERVEDEVVEGRELIGWKEVEG